MTLSEIHEGSKQNTGLAMLAGARAIEQNKRYFGAIFCHDIFGEHPSEISYSEAAKILRELGYETLGEGGEPND